MKTYVIEYFDRTNNYHGIGTFHQLNDETINKGEKFIVPSSDLLNGDSTSNRKIWLGCSEGRENHSAFMKPLLLTCSGSKENHIISEKYGAFRKDLCYIENK